MPKIGQPFAPYRVFRRSFYLIPEPVFRCSGMSTGAKLLYARLIRYAGKNPIAYPSQATLASELNISVRQVKRLLAELRQQKFVRTVPRGKANAYQLLWHPSFEAPHCPLSSGSLRNRPGSEMGQPHEIGPSRDDNEQARLDWFTEPLELPDSRSRFDDPLPPVGRGPGGKPGVIRG